VFHDWFIEHGWTEAGKQAFRPKFHEKDGDNESESYEEEEEEEEEDQAEEKLLPLTEGMHPNKEMMDSFETDIIPFQMDML
jgi:hypothetical protein